MTLLVALIMLVIITLFAVSSINTSSVNLRIVGNMQVQKTVEQSAQDAIEQVISSIAPFNEVIANPNLAPTVVTVNNLPVTVSRPQCLNFTPAAGYSALSALAPEDTDWEINATATDAASGAAAVVHQGLKIRLTAGNCV
ncbi:MAG: pilus assembly PilX family protein [Betaproteobacteria bacterium]